MVADGGYPGAPCYLCNRQACDLYSRPQQLFPVLWHWHQTLDQSGFIQVLARRSHGSSSGV